MYVNSSTTGQYIPTQVDLDHHLDHTPSPHRYSGTSPFAQSVKAPARPVIRCLPPAALRGTVCSAPG